MARRKCPYCGVRKIKLINHYNSPVKEYKVKKYQCKLCSKQHDLVEMHKDRADELLRYEKAYWKMKDLLDKYY